MNIFVPRNALVSEILLQICSKKKQDGTPATGLSSVAELALKLNLRYLVVVEKKKTHLCFILILLAAEINSKSLMLHVVYVYVKLLR